MKKLLFSFLMICAMALTMLVGCDEPSDHEHDFNQAKISEEYLKEEGSCEKKTTYYYSCECGEIGETFFEDDFVHDFKEKNKSAEYLRKEGDCKDRSSYYHSCSCGEKGTAFFYGDFVHNPTEKVTNCNYFAEDSTATSAAKYYYSCSCGVKSTDTFEHGKKDSERAAVGSKAGETLNGKKILIVGCSYNFYGKIVVRHDDDVTSLSSRVNDIGYFYELCKQNGADVSVTNWTFGHHNLVDLLGTSCDADRDCGNGFNHLAELTDRDYDYVSLMDIARPSKLSLEEYIEELKGFMKLFTDVNPDCKFIYSIPCGAYWYKHVDRTDFKDTYIGTVYAKEIAKLDNMIVMDWGRMIYDLIKGYASVPGSSFAYNENSLIVGDGYHPNLLSGYINALMTYCLITGETAVGQPINLENGLETGTAAKYKMSNYVANFYKNKTTNFVQIMESESEMQGIQKLIDRYIDMDAYLYY